MGKRFGKLLVVEERGPEHGAAIFRVDCSCGSKRPDQWVRASHLLNGAVTGCKCKRFERINLEHGHSSHRAIGRKFTPTYFSWRTCVDTAKREDVYIDPRWEHSFPNFLSDMGERPIGMRMQRKDLEKGFDKDNCIWHVGKRKRRPRSGASAVAFMDARHAR
jgi:hypothetical protein